MTVSNKKSTLVLLVCGFFVANLHSIFAYIDPGTTSYLLQLLAAGLFASGIAIKIFWSKIKVFFQKKGPKKEDGPAEVSDD